MSPVLRKVRSGPPWATMLVCCIAQFMVILDVTIVNVALPQMRLGLGLSVDNQQWVINAYTLTFAGFLMLGGRAADLWGRRRVFVVGITLFTFFSLFGGLAQNGTWLIAARALQGLGGAILAPSTLSLLTSKFTEPHERRRALGAWSTTSACGAAVGVLTGGILTDLLDWRWVLFVNVPIGVAVIALTFLALSESRSDSARARLDVTGAVTVTLGLAAFVYAVVGTDTHPWGSPRTIITLGVATVLILAFVLTETRFAKAPLVPFSIFRRRALSIANIVTIAIGSANFGGYFFLSLYLQQVLGYSPLRAGLGFLPIGLSAFSGAFFGTRLVARIGVRRQLVLGPALAASGLIWIALAVTPERAYVAHLLLPLILFGFGTGMAFVPMAMAGTQGVPPHQAGLASALINTTRQLGGAIGLAAMATAASSLTSRHLISESAPTAITDGYALAFLIAGVGLAVAAFVALALPTSPAATRTVAVRSGGIATDESTESSSSASIPARASAPADS